MATFSFDTDRTVDEIFHRFHLPGINAQYNEKYWIWNMVAQGSDPDVRFETNEFGGTEAKFALEFTRQPGFGPVADGGTLNQGKLYTVVEASERIWEVQQPVRLTGSSIRLSQSNLGSYARYMNNTSNNATQAMFQKLCWLMYAHPAGALAQVSAAATLTNAAGGVEVTFDNVMVDFENFLVDMIGEEFSFVAAPNGSSSSLNGKGILRSVTPATTDARSVKAKFSRVGSSNISVADNSYLMLGSYDQTAKHSQLPFGLMTLLNADEDLHGVSVSDNPRWKPTSYSAPNTLAETVLDRAMRQINTNAGTVDGVCAVMDPKSAEVLAHTLLNNKRYVNTTSPPGGVQLDSLQAGPYSVPLVTDIYAPPENALLLSKNELMKFEAVSGIYSIRPPGASQTWVHELTSAGSYRDSYQMWMGAGYSLATKHRNRHALVTNIN